MAELTQDSIAPVASPVSARGAQLLILIATAALTYGGLSRLLPVSQAVPSSDRIQTMEAAPVQAPPAPTLPAGPRVMETIPLQTEIIQSPRHARLRTRHHLLKKPQASLFPEPAQAQPAPMRAISISEREALQLGLVPETIVVPKKEVYEVSSLVLVKPHNGARKPTQD